ncbi:unnamed protein product [Mytilus coruscus]|uniref:Reverse transcriptase domain-containing protein n=1 Tax=Mytilus coruscus TaxID=42192 RepID=A0A6J8CV39_MYTCO|nr:unnamed protein product [Mytilus coruscus]
MTELNNNQSELQFKITKGLSPIMAALLVSERIVHAKQQNMTMFLATLDSQKAFDVVHHMILLENCSMKFHLTYGECKQFPIHQGVRQGGVLSTHLYKLYINDLPEELERRGLGLNIGLEYCGSPLCADDIVLMTTDETEIQAMLDIGCKYSC